ncbi:hypothetical protein [Pseudonocardia asaccharolytica]|uniref:Phage head morphogenesis domain-containing protein n=1 Tax=Pseudonocardia asaccharolytica DSM 44247 = NBRC 16224 TaxID=1123024 RepID=A0A511D3J7_9PSEU|nr:hypothetical protein [Pseudonocardia asaccharolytica]GEL19352.1 hypothetical protein PA7_31890 [Pseudonocardia asaccharolytica DSM 44247 = NBRC 16224]
MVSEGFAQRRRALSERLIDALVALFLGLGSWRDEDAARFVAQAVPLVEGAQHTLAGLVAYFTAVQASEAVGVPVAPPPIPAEDVTGLRAGVTPAEVYRRPFTTVYTGLGRGLDLPTAVERGATRLQEITEMDLQQTYARAARSAMRSLPGRARPTGWRRVLVGPGNCALCVVASTQRYTLADLNPIHPGCDCTVAALYGGQEHVIEPELLERVHGAVEELTGQADRGARAPDYRKLVVSMTREHGELGPLLVRPLDRFTTAAQLPT